MAIINLNADNFNDVVGSSAIPVIVDFYADWCQPCKRIAPILEEIAAEHDGSVLVCKVDVDENQGLASQFSVMSIPNVISFIGGNLHKRVVGAAPKDELLALID